MKRIFLATLLTSCLGVQAQEIDIIYGDPSTEQILAYTSFVDSIAGDSLSDLVRIDHVGTGTGSFIPLVFSERTLRMKYPYEYIKGKLTKEQMNFLSEFILNKLKEGIPKKPSVDYGVFRVCYRIGGKRGTFFVAGTSKATAFFDSLQNHLKRLNSENINLVVIRYRRGAGI
jgi:hypothetical protein